MIIVLVLKFGQPISYITACDSQALIYSLDKTIRFQSASFQQ